MSHNITSYVQSKALYTDSQLDRRQLPRGYAHEVWIPTKMEYQGDWNEVLPKIPKHEDLLVPTPELMREIMPEGPMPQLPPAMLVDGNNASLPEKMGMQYMNTPITVDGIVRTLGDLAQEFLRTVPLASGAVPFGMLIYALVQALSANSTTWLQTRYSKQQVFDYFSSFVGMMPAAPMSNVPRNYFNPMGQQGPAFMPF